MRSEDLLTHLGERVRESWRERLMGDPEARMFIVTRGRRSMVVKVYPDGRHVVGRVS